MIVLSKQVLSKLSLISIVHHNKNTHSVLINQWRSIVCYSPNNLQKVATKEMKDTGTLLESLRNLMKNLPNNEGSIQAYVVPSDDAHQSEYIAPRDERRAFISGFNGSAGTAVITEDNALLWTDGRYYLQASRQLDNNWTLMKDGQSTTLSIDAWLAKNLKPGSKCGVDSNLFSTRAWTQLQLSLKGSGSSLVGIHQNLIDQIWTEPPSAPKNAVIPLSVEYTGRIIKSKLEELREKMSEKKVSVLIITALDEVAYFLNLRGSDIDFNPVFFSYVIVTNDNVYFFVDNSKLSSKIHDHFRSNDVELTIKEYSDIHSVFGELAQNADGKVWISHGSSYSLTALIPEDKLHQEITPIAVMKAIKNKVEVEGMQQCHIRDGVALCQYFAWLEKTVHNGEQVDEISGATKLEGFRKTKDKFMGLSFTTISSSGPNGSIIHYHPLPETNRDITDKEIYLCDSGAQFLDGTTDVTRTMHFGTPTDFERDSFTRVLKGQIGLSTTVFPQKTKGQFLDTIARKHLWDAGLDYAHGTGHGIGMFLNVHEGPMGIGIRPMPDDPGLQENMFVSNEPGFYEDGKFGIRIEDIVQIVPISIGKNFNGRGALTFHTVTMCPIQTKLIKIELLTEIERKHLNDYHCRVYKTLSPILLAANDDFTNNWLKRETQPI